MMAKKIAILASGNGSNAQNIIEFCYKHRDWYQIPIVICDNPDAYVLSRSEKLNVRSFLVPVIKKDTLGETRNCHENKILDILIKEEIDLVCLAGYRRLLTSKIIEYFYDRELKASRIINIHPSILPSFKGLHAYSDAFNYGVKISGVTLHFVDSEMDTGPIIVQNSFPRFEHDTEDDFIKRGMSLEYGLYQEALTLIANKKPMGTLLPSGRVFITFTQGEEHAALV